MLHQREGQGHRQDVRTWGSPSDLSADKRIKDKNNKGKGGRCPIGQRQQAHPEIFQVPECDVLGSFANALSEFVTPQSNLSLAIHNADYSRAPPTPPRGQRTAWVT